MHDARMMNIIDLRTTVTAWDRAILRRERQIKRADTIDFRRGKVNRQEMAEILSKETSDISVFE